MPLITCFNQQADKVVNICKYILCKVNSAVLCHDEKIRSDGISVIFGRVWWSLLTASVVTSNLKLTKIRSKTSQLPKNSFTGRLKSFFLNDSQLSWLFYTLELIHSFACSFLLIMIIIIIIKFNVMTKKTISCNAKTKKGKNIIELI